MVVVAVAVVVAAVRVVVMVVAMVVTAVCVIVVVVMVGMAAGDRQVVTGGLGILAHRHLVGAGSDRIGFP